MARSFPKVVSVLARTLPVMGALVLASGCASMPAYVRSAYYGNLESLQRDVKSAVAAGRVDRQGVLELAEAVARREVRSARGAAGTARLRAARGCARAVEEELRERARASDDGGAEASLVLLDAGIAPPGPLVDEYARASSGAWRAVAAYGTRATRFATLRRDFYVDPDERVRAEAFRAGLAARDPADRPALIDAMRLDPDSGNRAAAIRAAAALGGDEVATALRDLWAQADGPTRLSIVEAWAVPALFEAGGRERLVDVAETRSGMASVSAAGALADREGTPGRVGRAVLAHFAREGTSDERMLAVQIAPLDDPEVRRGIEEARTSDDTAVSVVAAARLLEVPALRAASVERLRRAAAGRDSASRQARIALASSGDASVAGALARDLSGSAAGLRRQIALGLFRLGKEALMAPVLADRDPAVRMAVACSVLSQATSG